MKQHRHRLLVLMGGIVSLSVLTPVASYASWLKCFVDLDDSEVIMNHEVLSFEDSHHKVSIEVKPIGDDAAGWSADFVYPPDRVTLIQARLVVPDALSESMFQYVMETTTDGARFLEVDMCEGRRTFARELDGYGTLEINGTSETVELWAGWATGYDAVSITDKLQLKRSTTIPPAESAEL